MTDDIGALIAQQYVEIFERLRRIDSMLQHTAETALAKPRLVFGSAMTAAEARAFEGLPS